LIRTIKQIAKKIVRATGFEIRRLGEIQCYDKAIRHAEVFPAATYSPWLGDEEFQRIYDVIRKHTLVDIYRCYELWDLIREVAKLKQGAVMEVGVWRGGTGALIARQCQLLGIAENIYLCDTFQGVVKAGKLDATYVGREHSDTTKQAVAELLQQLKLKAHLLQGIFPEETASAVSDSVFRFCHIDVDVYQSAKDIVEWIWPRLILGGVVVFDDYGFHSCVGITRLVNEEKTKVDRFVIHNLNGHAIMIKDAH
jgi:O-methyltransferase